MVQVSPLDGSHLLLVPISVCCTVRQISATTAGLVAAADDHSSINEASALSALHLHAIRCTAKDADRHTSGARQRSELGGWRLDRGCRASQRRPRSTRLADPCRSAVAVVRGEASAPLATQTTHPRPSNHPVHDEASLDVRGGELARRVPGAGRLYHAAGAQAVACVQRTA